MYLTPPSSHPLPGPLACIRWNVFQSRLAVQEGNVDVASSVSTDAGRVSMLRHAVHETLQAASHGRQVTSVPAREFISGLSRCLGVPEQRAIVIVHAATAAELRSRLLAIAAARRGAGGGQPAAAAEVEVQRLLRAVETFPMPAGAPEAEMVGTAIRTKFTLQEMETLLKELVCPLAKTLTCSF